MTNVRLREQTRKERYSKQSKLAKIIPVSVATINFHMEANIAYVVRAAACFGAYEVCLVGSMMNRDSMNDMSGSTYDYMSIKKFSVPEGFVQYCRKNNVKIISFELPDSNFSSININEFKFDKDEKYCIVVGNETLGVPVEILAASDYRVYIPMNGFCVCLNTSQAANIALYEAAKQLCSGG